MTELRVLAILGLLSTTPAWTQTPPETPQNVPIYRVTVTERTIKAVDYQYRSGPTMIDFRGTVLLPRAKGTATVESKAGRTEIDVKFDRVEAPTRYGREYLTYVLWAITPEGHAKNLGEVLADGGNHARLHVTTDLQAFGMLVTAEPYSAVREPSDVVVMENEVRPDTVGHIEYVAAKYDLLPRGHYTYNVPAGFETVGHGAAIPFDRYEEIVEVYQAQNAVQIARAQGAVQYAPDTFFKAEQLMRQAQEFQIRRVDKSTVITAARQAAQTAEDARMITVKRKQAEEVARVRDQAAREQELRVQAEAEAQRARAQSSADRMQLADERAARERAERELMSARTVPPPPPAQPIVIQTVPPPNYESQKTELRLHMLRELNAVLPARDTPRGLVVTLSDGMFHGSMPASAIYGNLARIASMVAAQPGISIHVDGHTDLTGSEARDERLSYERAASVRDELIRAGVPASAIVARGLGGSRPLVSNASASGRAQNRRVEITLFGDPIGIVPSWDRTYSALPRR